VTENRNTEQRTAISESFLETFYKNQYEQRWRESRKQDWALLGVTGTISVAIVTLNLKVGASETVVASFKLIVGVVLPILLFFFCEVGIRILLMHKGVMDHANHIATGIEKYFGIEESRESKSIQNDKMDVKVVHTDEGVKIMYPAKAIYMKSNPISYWQFSKSMFKEYRVQSAMGLIYRSFQFLALGILVNYIPLNDFWETLTQFLASKPATPSGG